MAPTAPPTPSVPPPTPTPTQVVIVNLPSDVLDKLSPHETGLPISWATIIAACITVLAALVALAGIWWQIRAAARESRSNRVADAKLARQSHLAERMGEALGIARSLEDLLGSNTRDPLGKWAAADQHAFDELTQRSRTLVNILSVLGADESSAALHRFTFLSNVIAKDQARGSGGAVADSLDGKSYLELRDGLHSAFKSDLSVLGASPAENTTYRT
ncbi:hypothetical protein [Mycolicibacterium rhodesiae]|uniref:hypothetical protein n=1 Tax=Mycolicibacterium rhodesiae TaxID=36814 RepID=UPI0013FE3127|nr:hypothetical protein [Mycolicibacterium rhodesiae]MCV7346078.1 hypothetical protein [Mycolicibacterium rhodesiae]